MRHAPVAALILSSVIVAVLGMPQSGISSEGEMSNENSSSGSSSKGSISKGNPFSGNCKTTADCPELSVCVAPGFGKANAKAQKKCVFCNCTESNQCLYENGMMTCNCTGSGYSGLFCEILMDIPCGESDVCVDGVIATYTISASTTPQIVTSPDFPHEYYCDGLKLYWIITAPTGKRIQITFTYFVLEFDFDFVYIFDGECSNIVPDCNRIVYLTGNDDPNWMCKGYAAPEQPIINVPIVSTLNVATIYFETDDCCDTAPGWSASVIYID